MSDIVGVKKASDILGVSKKTVYSKLRSGDIKGKKVETKYGKKWVIDLEDLNEYDEKAKMENEVIEIRELDVPMDKDELLNSLVEVIQGANEEVMTDIINNAVKQINEENKKNKNDIIDILDKQNELIQKQSDRIQELEEEVNKNWWEKIKSLI